MLNIKRILFRNDSFWPTWQRNTLNRLWFLFYVSLCGSSIFSPLCAKADAIESIAPGDTWSYFKGPDTPPSDWKDATCASCDSWSTGKSGFGYSFTKPGNYYYLTELADMRKTTLQPGYKTLYIRKEFTISNPETISHLNLTVYHDDAFIAYLNGTEVARANISNSIVSTRVDIKTTPQPLFDLSDKIGLLKDGNNVLTIEGHNFDLTSSDFALTPILTYETYELPIERGDNWSYFKGKTAPPSNWRDISCNGCDSWSTGRSGFGYGGHGERTVLSDMRTNYVTVYIRKKFFVSDPTKIQKLLFSIDADDGFVAYLNGTIVASSNVDTSSIPPKYDTVATTIQDPGEVQFFDITTFTDLLIPGDNVIGIQGHNRSLDSSDFLLSPRLISMANELPILSGDTWSYFKGTTPPPAEWKDASCIGCDSWSEGTSGFGFGDNDDSTILSASQDYTSVYIRKKFKINDLAEIKDLTLSVDYDDGFVAYINGVEVVRRNMQENGNATEYWQTAKLDHEAGIPEHFDLIKYLDLLKDDQTNILAIQGHNVRKNSSDFSLTASLSTEPIFLVGAGDIARSTHLNEVAATGRIIDDVFQYKNSGGTLITLGDNAYGTGTLAEFEKYYDPYWGREHKKESRPSVGNHEYMCPDNSDYKNCLTGAADYFTYFNEASRKGDPNQRAGNQGRGYYSYDAGYWHIIVLNSCGAQARAAIDLAIEQLGCKDSTKTNCGSVERTGIGCTDDTAGLDEEQMNWLKADLENNRLSNILAYWHHPLYTNGLSENAKGMLPVWKLLYHYGADIILNGHDHNYQRFEPKNPSTGEWGTKDEAFGIRQFVIGTGGGNHYGISATKQKKLAQAGVENSSFFHHPSYGILKLELLKDSYKWEFLHDELSLLRDKGESFVPEEPLYVTDGSLLDDFSVDTSFLYDVNNMYKKKDGRLLFDEAGKTLKVLTGDDVGLTIARNVSAGTEGRFGVKFNPLKKYPRGGAFTIRLIQDSQNYFKVERTDGYDDLGTIVKIAGGKEVARTKLVAGYEQGSDYKILVHFSPSEIIVSGFGACAGYAESCVLPTGDLKGIAVKRFEISVVQQDAYLDDISYQLAGVHYSALSADIDNDGVTNNNERLAGTNQFDMGSFDQVLSVNFCSEWNGNLGMINFYEHQNLSEKALNVNIKLLDAAGVVRAVDSFRVPPGTQFDYPVHDMNGFDSNSYGQVCSTHNGKAGDMDGRMVYYLANDSVSNGALLNSFQFAFAMPISNGKIGKQFVPFNNMQPSLDPSDGNNIIANWIQISNLSDYSATGRLFFYSSDGSVLGDVNGDFIRLEPGQRTDRGTHQFGASNVGLVEWRPDDNSVPFIVRNSRYFYDNPGNVNSFDSAFQVEGGYGSGEELIVPLDTRRNSSSVVEVFNTFPRAVKAWIDVYDDTGTRIAQLFLSEQELPARGSIHLMMDLVLGVNKRGFAVIQGEELNSIGAVAVQYARNASGGIEYAYGTNAKLRAGGKRHGTYNTFINQESTLIVINPLAEAQTIALRMTRFDGANVLSDYQRLMLANNRIDIRLNSFDSENVYGNVTLDAKEADGISAWALRTKEPDYVIVTPLR